MELLSVGQLNAQSTREWRELPKTPEHLRKYSLVKFRDPVVLDEPGETYLFTYETDRGPVLAPIQLGESISRDRRTADPGARLRAEYPIVPLTARNLEFRLTDVNDESTVSAWTIKPRLSAGAAVTVTVGP